MDVEGVLDSCIAFTILSDASDPKKFRGKEYCSVQLSSAFGKIALKGKIPDRDLLRESFC